MFKAHGKNPVHITGQVLVRPWSDVTAADIRVRNPSSALSLILFLTMMKLQFHHDANHDAKDLSYCPGCCGP